MPKTKNSLIMVGLDESYLNNGLFTAKEIFMILDLRKEMGKMEKMKD